MIEVGQRFRDLDKRQRAGFARTLIVRRVLRSYPTAEVQCVENGRYTFIKLERLSDPRQFERLREDQ